MNERPLDYILRMGKLRTAKARIVKAAGSALSGRLFMGTSTSTSERVSGNYVSRVMRNMMEWLKTPVSSFIKGVNQSVVSAVSYSAHIQLNSVVYTTGKSIPLGLVRNAYD